MIVACIGATWLVLNKLQILGCNGQGNQWTFSDCNLSYLVLFLYDVQTMLCATICRWVFIKNDQRDISCIETFAYVKNDIIRSKDGYNFSDQSDQDEPPKDIEIQPLPPKKRDQEIRILNSESKNAQPTEIGEGDEDYLPTERPLITEQEENKYHTEQP